MSKMLMRPGPGGWTIVW